MNTQNSAYDDPMVDEVRRIRAKLWREAGGTVEGLHRLLDERDAERRKKEKENETAVGADGQIGPVRETKPNKRQGAAAPRDRKK